VLASWSRSLVLTIITVIVGLITIDVNDTVWWNTPGAKVIEHRNGSNLSCTLLFTNRDGVVALEWSFNGELNMALTKEDWKFSKKDSHVAVRIGDTWLNNGDGQTNIEAIDDDTTVLFQLPQPIDDLLFASDQITVKIDDEAFFTMTLPTTKMSALKAGVSRCRDLIGKISK
jgi:hypothetical protein